MQPRTGHSLDFILLAITVLIQTGIFLTLRRDLQAARRTTRFAIWALASTHWAVMLTGWALGFLRLQGWTVPAATRIFPEPWYLTGGFLSGAVFLLYRLLRPAVLAEQIPGRRALLQQAAVAVVAAPVAAVGYGTFIERARFEVKEIALPVENLHSDFEGVGIAQISDLHVSPMLSIRELNRAIGMTNELKPFVTLVTGDLISYPGDPLDDTIRALAALRADQGVFGCLGNHEIYCRAEDYTTREAARYGIEFLRMHSRRIHRGDGVLNLAGVDFQPFQKRHEYLSGAERILAPGMPNILLSHNPDVFPVASRIGFDVTLAGHTHGGQVTVEILKQYLNVVRFLTPYVSGLYTEQHAGKKRACYVTAGIGTIGMPVRIGVPPEITLLRLRRA